MESSSSLQLNHEDSPVPPLFITGFYHLALFFTYEQVRFGLAHKVLSGMFWGNFLELRKDGETGSLVIYVSISPWESVEL